MTTYSVYWKAATKEILVLASEEESVDGFDTIISTFEHDGETDDIGSTESHVLWHHVRDALNAHYFAVGTDNPVPDMTLVRISINSVKYPPEPTITVGDATFYTSPGGTAQIVATVNPVDYPNQTLIYTSSNPALAAVSNTGLVDFVPDGEGTVTVTVSSSYFTATATVFIEAAML